MSALPPSLPVPSSRVASSRRGRFRRGAAVATLVSASLIGTSFVGASVGAPAASAASGITISKATFAREITPDFTAKGETTQFYGNETVYLLVRIKGRPKKGIVEGHWMFRGGEIGKASIDLASINKSVVFSFGEDSFVKFNFTPDKGTPLPIGTSYNVVVTTNGTVAGTYPFSILPPKGALASKVIKASLSKSEGGPATTTFAPNDTIFLNFTGDFGLGTWVEGEWLINGKEDVNGTRSITLKKDNPNVPGNFSYRPEGGWPKGKHQALLIMNDKKVGSYSFTVA